MSTTPNKKIIVRQARFSELPEVAHVAAKAFWNEDLFGKFIHPNRAQYPDDFRLFWLKKLRKDFFDWNFVFLITTEVDQGSGDVKEKITGFGKWHRQGDSARKFGWGLDVWDPRNILSPTLKAYTYISSYFHTNRAAVPGREDILDRAIPFSEHHWSGDRAESWYLDLLGVHPDHQGQGIGRLLVEWGIRKADEEGVSASVTAAPNKDRFYQACGFHTWVGNACAGEGNPIASVPPGNIWFRDAKKGT